MRNAQGRLPAPKGSVRGDRSGCAGVCGTGSRGCCTPRCPAPCAPSSAPARRPRSDSVGKRPERPGPTRPAGHRGCAVCCCKVVIQHLAPPPPPLTPPVRPAGCVDVRAEAASGDREGSGLAGRADGDGAPSGRHKCRGARGRPRQRGCSGSRALPLSSRNGRPPEAGPGAMRWGYPGSRGRPLLTLQRGPRGDRVSWTRAMSVGCCKSLPAWSGVSVSRQGDWGAERYLGNPAQHLPCFTPKTRQVQREFSDFSYVCRDYGQTRFMMHVIFRFVFCFVLFLQLVAYSLRFTPLCVYYKFSVL